MRTFDITPTGFLAIVHRCENPSVPLSDQSRHSRPAIKTRRAIAVQDEEFSLEYAERPRAARQC